MRRRIRSAALRDRFEKAWSILPDLDRRRLRMVLRYVDEVDILEGTRIYARMDPGRGDVEVVAQLGGGVGFAAFINLPSGDVADVILPSNPLATCGEGPAVATILHELAHVVDHLERPEEAKERSRHRSEMYAWSRALAWTYAAPLGDEESGELASDVVSGLREQAVRGLTE